MDPLELCNHGIEMDFTLDAVWSTYMNVNAEVNCPVHWGQKTGWLSHIRKPVRKLRINGVVSKQDQLIFRALI